jgi:HxlR-like helix-turn-helix
MPKRYTPVTAAADVEKALRLLEGRWKLVILFHLFGGKVMRFSDLERAIPAITQKMLGQQLKAMEGDGIVLRTFVSASAAQSGIPADGMGAISMSCARCHPKMGGSSPDTQVELGISHELSNPQPTQNLMCLV